MRSEQSVDGGFPRSWSLTSTLGTGRCSGCFSIDKPISVYQLASILDTDLIALLACLLNVGKDNRNTHSATFRDESLSSSLLQFQTGAMQSNGWNCGEGFSVHLVARLLLQISIRSLPALLY